MGVCISIRRKPDLYSDALPHLNGVGGCKALFCALPSLPHVSADWVGVEPGDLIVRPSDFGPWHKWADDLGYNADIWNALFDSLERDKGLWLDFGY